MEDRKTDLNWTVLRLFNKRCDDEGGRRQH